MSYKGFSSAKLVFRILIKSDYAYVGTPYRCICVPYLRNRLRGRIRIHSFLGLRLWLHDLDHVNEIIIPKRIVNWVRKLFSFFFKKWENLFLALSNQASKQGFCTKSEFLTNLTNLMLWKWKFSRVHPQEFKRVLQSDLQNDLGDMALLKSKLAIWEKISSWCFCHFAFFFKCVTIKSRNFLTTYLNTVLKKI